MKLLERKRLLQQNSNARPQTLFTSAKQIKNAFLWTFVKKSQLSHLP